MAQLRRKMRLAIQLYETENNNRLKTGDPLTAEIYPAGAQVEVTKTVTHGVGVVTTINCSGRGSIPVGANVVVVRESSGVWTDLHATDFVLSGIEEDASSEGVFIFSLQNTSATTTFAVAPGDRIVAKREAANQTTIYEDESDGTDTIAQPIDVPENGLVEGYVDVRGVDLYLSGTSITDSWYGFNHGTSSGEIGPMRLKMESLAASNVMNIDADTSIVSLTSDAGAINLVEHCAPGRVLVLYPAAADIQVTTFNTKLDNTIYESTGRTISLDQDTPMILVGHEASTGIAYWTILGSPIQIDLDLGDIQDTNTAGAANGEPLIYDGSQWVSSDTIGTSGSPLANIYVSTSGLVIGTAGTTAQISTGNLSSAHIYEFPDADTQLIGSFGNVDIFGNKRFQAGATGFKMIDLLGSRIVAFDVSGLTALTTRTMTFPDADGTIALVSDVPTSLSDLSDADTAGATAGSVLFYDGSDFVPANAVGAQGAGNSAVVYIGTRSGGINIWDSSTFWSHWYEGPVAGTLTGATSSTTLPVHSGGVVMVDEYAPLTLTKSFQFDHTSTTKWGIFQEFLTSRNAGFIMRVPPATRIDSDGIVINRVTWDWHLIGAGSAATPTELNLYHAASGSYPSATTVPPAGTAILSANMQVPTGSTLLANSGTESFSDATIPADNLIYLGIAVNQDEPAAIGTLTLSIEYVLKTRAG